ncbi:MAG TPA: hypothetical protein VIV65_05445, partial [Gemmatimonadaceae bacterium]
VDMQWKLKLVHDGAVELTSVVNDFDPRKEVMPQVFPISFGGTEEELTKRIISLMHTRLNRIRYLWPFEDRIPTVIRDAAFVLPEGTPVMAQQVTWIDRDRNQFSQGTPFPTKVTLSEPYRFQFDPKDFGRSTAGDLLISPMSNSTYRLILAPPTNERPLFRYLTWTLVVLFVIAGVLGLGSLYRTRVAGVAVSNT